MTALTTLITTLEAMRVNARDAEAVADTEAGRSYAAGAVHALSAVLDCATILARTDEDLLRSVAGRVPAEAGQRSEGTRRKRRPAGKTGRKSPAPPPAPAEAPPGSYGHAVSREGPLWKVSWLVDGPWPECRTRRDAAMTDREGARRFASRWGLKFSA